MGRTFENAHAYVRYFEMDQVSPHSSLRLNRNTDILTNYYSFFFTSCPFSVDIARIGKSWNAKDTDVMYYVTQLTLYLRTFGRSDLRATLLIEGVLRRRPPPAACYYFSYSFARRSASAFKYSVR